MKRKPWLVFGAIGIGAVLAAACGGDDDSNGPGDSTGGTGGASTTGSGGTGGQTATNGSTTRGTTTGGPNTTGSSTGGTGGGGGTAGAGGECAEGGAAGMAGMSGEAAVPPSCEDIASRAFGDDEFTVASPDFDDCEPMPEETTCDGKLFPESVSPEVTWTEGPTGTQSYAVTFTDVTILTLRDPADPSYNQGYHWVIWDIPADTLSIPANLSSGYQPQEIEGALQWAPFNDYGFMGPCPNMPPPRCNPPPLNNDSYSFTVYAMPTATVEIPAGVEGHSFPRVMDDYLKENALAAAEYRGTSNAQASSIEGVFPPMFSVPCPSDGEQPVGCLEAE